MPAGPTETESAPLAELSARELDVLRLMAEGRSNAGIAEELSLSESSIEKHLSVIFSKLGLSEEPQLHRRVAAVVTFLRERHAGRGARS